MDTKPSVEIKYVDNPDLMETFADTVRGINFDGQTMRIELCVTRMEEPRAPQALVGRQHPACRLVLTPNAALDLFNKLQRIMTALEQKGAIKRETPPPSPMAQ